MWHGRTSGFPVPFPLMPVAPPLFLTTSNIAWSFQVASRGQSYPIYNQCSGQSLPVPGFPGFPVTSVNESCPHVSLHAVLSLSPSPGRPLDVFRPHRLSCSFLPDPSSPHPCLQQCHHHLPNCLLSLGPLLDPSPPSDIGQIHVFQVTFSSALASPFLHQHQVLTLVSLFPLLHLPLLVQYVR